jgi:hypothetical protein
VATWPPCHVPRQEARQKDDLAGFRRSGLPLASGAVRPRVVRTARPRTQRIHGIPAPATRRTHPEDRDPKKAQRTTPASHKSTLPAASSSPRTAVMDVYKPAHPIARLNPYRALGFPSGTMRADYEHFLMAAEPACVAGTSTAGTDGAAPGGAAGGSVDESSLMVPLGTGCVGRQMRPEPFRDPLQGDGGAPRCCRLWSRAGRYAAPGRPGLLLGSARRSAPLAGAGLCGSVRWRLDGCWA